jgi:hypothetical protein
MTRATLVASLVACLVLTAAGGCGDPQSDYCSAVKDHQKELSDVLAGGGPTALLDALPIFEDLARDAPTDIRDEWGTVIDALQGLEDALKDAGVDPATYDHAHPPPGLNRADRERIEAAASDVADPRTTAALAGLEQQARDVCQTPLSL